ncbi:hypothetical protein LJC14_07470 [Treponema sp. OttesenSCG-928-L16]|nr:hypothetical protein [Treponema sp. OttesenSCG-928-L16]
MVRKLFAIIFYLYLLIPAFSDEQKFSGVNIEIRPVYKGRNVNSGISSISYYVKTSQSFSELDRCLQETEYYHVSAPLHFNFRDGNYLIDISPPWLSDVESITFLNCDIELNGIVFPNVKSLYYYPSNYAPDFYKSFPNVETLEIKGAVTDLSFLWKLSDLKNLMIETTETNKTILSWMFQQYHEYITRSKTNVEGYVYITNVYGYPYKGDETYEFYQEPPEWYAGPDIAGVPAWVNDVNVNVRKNPSLNASIIKQLNFGDFVLIKGRAIPDYQWELPFFSQEDYLDKSAIAR